jgi:DNA (cytosine-5)-methyltransferase 1
MTLGSLFSGIGGLDLGLERAGLEIKWQVERDPYCRKVLAKHWPDVPCYEDVTTLTGEELEPVDVICGGFPCQPVSVAGTQKGTDDERWLWPEFNRLLRILRPRYAILENVPGLFTVQHGKIFGAILRDLHEGGYDAEWDCLSAADVGAPHLRKRVFIIATNRDMVDPERDGLAPFSQP